MAIYNPQNMLNSRVKEAKELLEQIPTKHCFITGSFLYKEKFKDIDLFVITRSKKEIKVKHPKAKITIIDFNDLHSLFYHSISKSCVAKDILPTKDLKVTLSDYWHVINETVPTIINKKRNFKKDIRNLILYTEYFKSKHILDSNELYNKIKEYQVYTKVLNYIHDIVPIIMNENAKKSYLKRFFYTQAALYKEHRSYSAQKYLYDLAHEITRG